ncbi:MAG: antitoxin Xre-like helix-turn-helix domain-containing protein [Eubacteriales bacterium]|nr:antitoxin Xre-like helix-turn-helix domain-containing protein [Eubacteriales bacterium]
MIKTAKLIGIIAEKGLTQKAVAKTLGINEATFYRKMKRGVFDSDEIYGMIDLLSIENPADIFFAKDGTRYVPLKTERTA